MSDPNPAQLPIAPLSSAVLNGRDCESMGAIDAVSEGHAAIALSRGGARKPYDYVDPNEDSALFAYGEGGILLAVADGHRGREASETVAFNLLEYHAARWTQAPAITDEAWPELAVNALLHLNAAILAHRARGEKGLFRTTLALALLRPSEDRLHFISIGDSHVFRLSENKATDLAWGRSSSGERYFLGDGPETKESLAKKCIFGSEALAGTWGVVLATDGLSESGIGLTHPEVLLAQIVDRAREAQQQEDFAGPERAGFAVLEATREIAERTLEAHRQHRAGDNLALAVSLLPRTDPL